ncbi:MAG: multiheme c-type cytochrome (seleno)protein ExtKL [Thermodesulfovibrionales bacterium]
MLLFVTLSALPLAVSAAEKKAKTIDELVKMYDVSSCKQCHAKIYAEWEKSAHATAMVGAIPGRVIGGTLGYLNDLMKWKHSGVKSADDVTTEHLKPCTDCHLPQLEDATDDVAKEIAKAVLAKDKQTLSKLGINCLVCHNKRAIIREWQDGKPEKGVVYGTKEGTHPDKIYSSMKKSPNMKEAVMCGRCHGAGPTLHDKAPTQCATLYGSYLHAYIPAGGNKTCQECHMEKGSHRWPGFITQGETVMKAPNRAFDVDIIATPYQFLERSGNLIPKTNLTVKITNKAGHRIPDG